MSSNNTVSVYVHQFYLQNQPYLCSLCSSNDDLCCLIWMEVTQMVMHFFLCVSAMKTIHALIKATRMQLVMLSKNRFQKN